MPDLSAIGALLSSLNAAKDIAKASMDLNTAITVQTQLADLGSKLYEARRSALALQDEHAAMSDRIKALEQEFVNLRERNREKEAYRLKEVYPGAFALARQPSDGDTNDPHWLCQHCFEKGENIVLQPRPPQGSWRMWHCPVCKTEIRTNAVVSPSKPFRAAKETP